MSIVKIGAALLILGDSADALLKMERPDAIVSDPPYGQAVNVNVIRKDRWVRDYPPLIGDDRPYDPAWVLNASDKVLLWGAHKFGDRLPRGRWFAWDKLPNGKLKSQGCGELAWSNFRPDAPLRMYRHLWDGFSTAAGYETRVERYGRACSPRVHPTQKPVDLMSWCLTHLDLHADSVVCDPYMGGGSTGIATLLAGHRFIGIEKEPRYFDAACIRIERAVANLGKD